MEEALLLPIPPRYADYPAPDTVEGGEPVLDCTGRHPRIAFAQSYYRQGLLASPTRLYLREGVFDRLIQALENLDDSHSFLIYDSLRPMCVQQALFDQYEASLAQRHPQWDRARVRQEAQEFVALPKRDFARPSSHMTGGAVDLTLCKGSVPLDMGTEFDAFGPAAYTAYFEREGLDRSQRKVRDNRRLLFHALRLAGFTNYIAEWWHYDYGNRSWSQQTGLPSFYSHWEGELR